MCVSVSVCVCVCVWRVVHVCQGTDSNECNITYTCIYITFSFFDLQTIYMYIIILYTHVHVLPGRGTNMYCNT